MKLRPHSEIYLWVSAIRYAAAERDCTQMVDQNTTIDTLDNVITLRTPQFSDEEALTWLRERGRITVPASHLARIWGWPERATRRKLERWERARLIRRKGKLVKVVAAKSDTPVAAKRTPNGHAQKQYAAADCATLDTNAALKLDTPNVVGRTSRSKPSAQDALLELPTTPFVPLPPFRVTERLAADLEDHNARVDYLTASGRVLAIGLAAVGLIANATFGASMGTTAWQQTLYALLWAAIDGVAFWLPSMALCLWRNQHRIPSAAAWVVCVGAIYASALAVNGFLSSTVGNTIAERHNLIEHRDRLT